MRVLSLFSGCGGLDMGFEKSGYQIIWANDFDKYACETYKANFDNNIICGDINEIPLKSLPDFDILNPIQNFLLQKFRNIQQLMKEYLFLFL